MPRPRHRLTPAQHAQLTKLGRERKQAEQSPFGLKWRSVTACPKCRHALDVPQNPRARREGFAYLECPDCGWRSRPIPWAELEARLRAATDAGVTRVVLD